MAKDIPAAGGFLAAFLSFVFVLALLLLAEYPFQPPSPLPATAPQSEFSAERAMEHVREVARNPHPTGSAEDSRVRDYISRQMEALAIETAIQTAAVVRTSRRRRGAAVGATVHNIACRLPGSASTKAVLLVTHHDSVPTGTGASDDGSGVATLIETARALRASPRLRNDVLFLFTDAEELGLLGATAFVNEHPWAGNVGVVLNFEARGSCGPSMMFETSAHNGWLIHEVARAAPRTLASSFMYDFYRRMPNDTDLTVFKNAGLAGLNFAYAGCWPRYHTMGDSIENIDPRSLQHDGYYALTLARRFGGLDLTHTSESDAVYFSLLNRLVHYPSNWTPGLTVLTVILFVAVLVLGFRTDRLRWRGVGFGALGCLGAAAAAAAVSQLAWSFLKTTPLASMLPYGMAYNSEQYAAAFLGLTAATFCAAAVWLRRRFDPLSLSVGMLIWWLAGSVLTGLYAPGGNYLFVWPLMLALLVLGALFALDTAEGSGRLAWSWALPVAAAALLFAPVVLMLLDLLSTSGLIPLAISATLLLGFLLPVILVVAASWRGWLPAGLAALTLCLMVVAATRAGYNQAHPEAVGLFYYLDADTGRASFVTTDSRLNTWTAAFMKAGVEHGNLRTYAPFAAPVLLSPAPAAPLEPPALSTLQDVGAGDLRILRLQLRSPRHSRAMWISAGSSILGALINGKEIAALPAGGTEGGWGVYYVGAPESTVELSLVTRREEKLSLRVVDQSDGFPALGGSPYPPRPPDLMPSPALIIESSTLVSRTFQLPTPQ